MDRRRRQGVCGPARVRKERAYSRNASSGSKRRLADASATIAGSLAGTSTVVSYIESSAGVAAGGRTGVTAIVTGLLFLAVL